MPATQLRVDGLTKSFAGRTVLGAVNFEALGGGVTAIAGPSGCGKTTLLNCIGCLEPVDEGSILLRTAGRGSLGAPPDNQADDAAASAGAEASSSAQSLEWTDLTTLSPHRRRLFFRDTVGFVFQNSGLVDEWTVAQNLRVPFTPDGRKASKAQIAEALGKVGGEHLERAKVFTLSGGEQQRVALARLLLKDPVLVLADEPMAALDQDNANLVFGTLKGLARRGALVLMCSHDPATIERCDRVVELPAPKARGGKSAGARLGRLQTAHSRREARPKDAS
jgi:putative ABC transport system ATP-binding protein